MGFLTFDSERCNLCGLCIEQCPFQAMSMEASGIEVNEKCRMCGLCVKNCPEKAIRFEQKAGVVNKDEWKGILVFGEQEGGRIHPVVPELIG